MAATPATKVSESACTARCTLLYIVKRQSMREKKGLALWCTVQVLVFIVPDGKFYLHLLCRGWVYIGGVTRGAM